MLCTRVRLAVHLPQQLLHGPDVGTVVEHVGGARVPQHVRVEALPQPGPAAGVPHEVPARLAGEPATAADSLPTDRCDAT